MRNDEMVTSIESGGYVFWLHRYVWDKKQILFRITAGAHQGLPLAGNCLKRTGKRDERCEDKQYFYQRFDEMRLFTDDLLAAIREPVSYTHLTLPTILLV